MDFRGFLVLIGLYLGFGYFFVPVYEYNEDEMKMLTTDNGVMAHLLWPARGWSNWQNCGKIGYCRETRCAALEFGCTEPTVKSTYRQIPLFLPPNLNQVEKAERTKNWCEATEAEYTEIRKNYDASVAFCAARPNQTDQNKSTNSTDGSPQIDTSNLYENCSNVDAPLFDGFIVTYEKLCN